MTDESLTAVLEREHHEIDEGIESFLEGLDVGEIRRGELSRAADALRRHIYLEEEFLFPPIRDAGLVPPVVVMLREHGDIWRTLDAFEEALQDGLRGVDPAGRYGADELAGLGRELLAQLDSHNSKEEPVIYPQGDAVLSDEAKRKLHEFIDTGRMPDGWTCERA